MFGVDFIGKFYSVLFLVLLFSSSIHSLPVNFLNFKNPNFPRQFVQQQLSPLTPSGETTYPKWPSNVNNLPTYYSNSRQQFGNTGENNKNPFPYPQRITTTDYYSTSTTATNTTEYYTTTEKYAGSSSTTESNSSAGEEEEHSSYSTTTITPFLNSDIPGFPINPPPTFPGLPTAGGGQLPKPSVSSTLLDNYPQQHIDGAVGPFPEKNHEQLAPWGLVGTFSTGVGQLLQRLNPLQLLRPVADTFQNIGHVLSHPNYGPGSAFLRPIQFWSAVNGVGNPNFVPYRKLPADADVVMSSFGNRKQEII